MKRRCLYCSEATIRACTTCDAPYCSESCEKADGPSHQITCHAKLEDRIRSVVEYIVGACSDSEKNHEFNICCTLSVTDPNSTRRLLLSAYGGYSFCSCAVCGKPKINDSTYLSYRVATIKKTKITYYVCLECRQHQKELCHQWFRLTSECTNTATWWAFLLCLRRTALDVPKDIKRMLFNELRPCTTGHKFYTKQ